MSLIFGSVVVKGDLINEIDRTMSWTFINRLEYNISSCLRDVRGDL